MAPSRTGSHDTEMNYFRYDAILYVGPPAVGTPVAEPVRGQWTSADELEAVLADQRPDAMVVAGVPNRRVAAQVPAWHRILEGAGTAGTLRTESARVVEGVDPEFFPEWAERWRYEAGVGWWLDDGGSGTYDVVCAVAAR
ncbi:hypothetical protein [Streptomyces violaceusniger]|uniref:Uncharacterized protein n=1 Tax=Streptomyces violaceusniger TaxID=68280 RepID=A0A4D4KRN9_STRVO|nr:hypothetical protein SVIO_001890 [Streptomyces violaceusniger]